jgi:GNAT superfamily N-acetyltransferase
MEECNMEIRLANAEDLAAILQYDRHIPPERVEACVCGGTVRILCEGSCVLGILRYSLFWQSVPFLDLLYIDESHRALGWGSKMMRKWEREMADRGYSYVMLSTQEDETAKYFYEKLGYRRIGAFLPPEQDADEIMYLKELTK